LTQIDISDDEIAFLKSFLSKVEKVRIDKAAKKTKKKSKSEELILTIDRYLLKPSKRKMS
jgi:hypothetical protein